MNEDFVTYEIAVKLKEKGYNCELPYAMYNEIGQFCLLTSSAPYHVCESGYKYREYYDYNDFDKNDFIAPTISQVLKWLREEKRIFIDIRTSIDLNGKEHFSYYIIHNKVSIREGYTDFDWNFELAALAGIWYVLDNLI